MSRVVELLKPTGINILPQNKEFYQNGLKDRAIQVKPFICLTLAEIDKKCLSLHEQLYLELIFKKAFQID